ncbi:RAD59 [[Candida] subhashii]|uniref:DNA repair and recombination protein RAD52 n=1 Tax=[Candida] subhashii TaxID=561895 RepID=A0A8J5QH14_9ASCO|nr:RAD59 [[Candida] subhashii]KAG7661959.1 RAD59 [[Candida] subhashii]
MAFNYDSKYGDVDNEGNNLSSSVEFFPDMSQFLSDEDVHADGDDDENAIRSDWALMKIGTLQSRLEAIQTSRDSLRYGSGRRRENLVGLSSSIFYKLANEVFGFNGWCSNILSCEMLDCNFNQETSTYSAKCLAHVRIILKDGTYRDEYGMGQATNLPSKPMCYNKCRKQAITDGNKNAILSLRNLCLEYQLQ